MASSMLVPDSETAVGSSPRRDAVPGHLDLDVRDRAPRAKCPRQGRETVKSDFRLSHPGGGAFTRAEAGG